MTHTQSMMLDAKEQARRERVAAIRDGAIVRQSLGILAQHRREPNGDHTIFWFDRGRGELREFTATMLEEAIASAKAGRPRA